MPAAPASLPGDLQRLFNDLQRLFNRIVLAIVVAVALICWFVWNISIVNEDISCVAAGSSTQSVSLVCNGGTHRSHFLWP